MSKSVTLAVRVPQEIRQQLEEKVALGAFSSLTALLRDVLTEFARDSSLRKSKHGKACKQHELDLSKDETCPLVLLVRSEACRRCGYREQPIVNREEVPFQ